MKTIEKDLNKVHNKVMIQVNINEIKAHLSEYLARVEHGETIILCRHNKPIAEIHAIQKEVKKEPRPLGLGRGTGVIPPEFYEPWPDDFIDLFYNGEISPK